MLEICRWDPVELVEGYARGVLEGWEEECGEKPTLEELMQDAYDGDFLWNEWEYLHEAFNGYLENGNYTKIQTKRESGFELDDTKSVEVEDFTYFLEEFLPEGYERFIVYEDGNSLLFEIDNREGKEFRRCFPIKEIAPVISGGSISIEL